MRSRTLVLVSATLAILVAGCQHSPRSRMPEPVARPSHPPGYVAEQRYATKTIHETWVLAGEQVETTLVRPTGTGVFPLIVYLPGLGEPSSGGAAWRDAWAQAGYAVLSLQSPANGETILTSAQARRAEFLDLAREQFSPTGLAKRLAILRNAFEELNRRQGRGAFADVDTSHVALAGFDLGAQTVMAAAGETGYGIEPFALPPAVQCVIALSPYADFSGAGFDQRFATIHVPVLSVTSINDTDAYGLVGSPAVRRAPFEHMPPGRKYLLSLVGAPHALIAGRQTPSADTNAPARDDGARAAGGGATNPGGTAGRRRGDGAGSPRGRRDRSTESGDASSSSSRTMPSAAWAAQLALVQSVTAAYLDASLRNDGVAQEWLTRDARRWLGDDADLIVK